MTTLYPNVRVNALVKGAMAPGTITARNADGSYSVQLDSGETASNVPLAGIQLGAGTRIRAKWHDGKLYKGTVVQAVTNGTHYNIVLDAGVHEPLHPLRDLVVEDPSKPPSYFEVGDRVWANNAAGEYKQADVIAVQPDGSFTIRFETGEVETNLPVYKLTPLPQQPPPKPQDKPLEPINSGTTWHAAKKPPIKFTVGKRVEAKWKGGRYFKGSILAANADDTYAVAFDEGGIDDKVPVAHILPVVAPNAVSPNGGFQAGQRVEARWQSRKYLQALVTARNSNGTYAIVFDDGAEVPNQDRFEMKQLKTSGPDTTKLPTFQVGQRVDARWKGGSFYAGRITAVNDDGTYAIAFDDGDFESRESVNHIAPYATKVSPFQIGDAVKAQWTNGEYYAATITTVNGNGTFGVLYSDGISATVPVGQLEKVVAATVVASSSGGGGYVEPTIAENVWNGPGFDVGLRVYSKWTNDTFYPGTISHVNYDGTYDVAYDDGFSETYHPQYKIRVGVGTRVQARWNGLSSYYLGVVTEVNSDGTYYITYDDGGTEYSVPASYVKSPSEW